MAGKTLVSLELPKYKAASEFYTQEEMIAFRKPKKVKKKKKILKRGKLLKADELIPDEPSEQNLGSRNRGRRRQDDDEDAPEGEAMDTSDGAPKKEPSDVDNEDGDASKKGWKKATCGTVDIAQLKQLANYNSDDEDSEVLKRNDERKKAESAYMSTPLACCAEDCTQEMNLLSDLHVCVQCEPNVLKLLWNPKDPSFQANIQKVAMCATCLRKHECAHIDQGVPYAFADMNTLCCISEHQLVMDTRMMLDYPMETIPVQRTVKANLCAALWVSLLERNTEHENLSPAALSTMLETMLQTCYTSALFIEPHIRDNDCLRLRALNFFMHYVKMLWKLFAQLSSHGQIHLSDCLMFSKAIKELCRVAFRSGLGSSDYMGRMYAKIYPLFLAVYGGNTVLPQPNEAAKELSERLRARYLIVETIVDTMKLCIVVVPAAVYDAFDLTTMELDLASRIISPDGNIPNEALSHKELLVQLMKGVFMHYP